MSFSDVRCCPCPDCEGEVTLAAMDVAEQGGPIWQCSEGHRGPEIIGTASYSTSD